MTSEGWAAYLRRFHQERAGITEAVLRAAVDDQGLDPYSWLAQALPEEGVVVDVACGSGPLAASVGRRWTGYDTSPTELALAARRVAGRVVQADAAALPVAAGSADAVACAMALMLIEPLDPALAEVRRVLTPGGRLVALVPAPGPLGLRDRLRHARLAVALGVRRLPFPGSAVLRDTRRVLDAAGFRLVGDERRRFVLPLDAAAGERLVRSLYLPGAGPDRVARATAVARHWAGSDLGLPLRRLLAVPGS